MEQATNNNATREPDRREDQAHSGMHTKPPLNSMVPFWSTIIPVLISRQLFQSANKILQPFSQKYLEKLTHRFPRYLVNNAYSLSFGSLIATVSGFYAKRNLEAIKTLYADAVGNELGKNADDVSTTDILFRSKNTVVRDSVREFTHTGIIRSLAVSAFFLPWQFFSKDKEKPHNIQASVGAGVMGLSVLKDRLGENTSMLNTLWNLVDNKFHHNNSNPYDIMTANDIGRLLVIQHKKADKSYHQPALTTAQEQQEKLLSQQLADKLNNTYHNTDTAHSHFTFGKFIYLMGMEADGTGKTFLNQPFPVNMAYVELADKHSAKEIQDVAKAIASGTAWQEAFAKYGITLAGNVEQSISGQKEPDMGSQHTPAVSFADREKGPESYVQKAQSKPGDNTGIFMQ